MADLTDRRMRWADAWQQLVYDHSPFRAVDDEDFRSLLAQVSELERLFLTNERLHGYYAEWEPSAAASSISDSPRELTIHVAVIQLQLMEDAFYSLRLDRYANAPDNRGWLNLFRRWATSPTFREHVKHLADTFSKQFMLFYAQYIEHWTADLPVPHPWDLNSSRESFAEATKYAIKHCRDSNGKGIFLDPGRVEAGTRGPYQKVEPLPVTEGQHGAKASSAGQAPAPGPAPEDSSKTTD